MIKKIVLLFVFGFICTTVFSQVRHIKGLKGVELILGATGQGPYASAGYSQYIHREVYLKGAFGYERGDASGSDFSTYFLDATGHYTFYSVNPNFFLNAVAGLTGLYENVEKKEIAIEQSGSSIGVLIGLEAEIYIDHRWAVVVNGSQRHYFQSDFGKNRWLLGAGIKRILDF
ncbi:MAG: conjugal transfer protein TraO [Cyclobacteriaceae bacterium]